MSLWCRGGLFLPPFCFCQIKTDTAARGNVRYKLTEVWATNRQRQVLRRIVILVVIVCYLKERERGRGRGRRNECMGAKRRGMGEGRKEHSEKKERGNHILVMTACWACSPGAHWSNMHAANCTAHGTRSPPPPSNMLQPITRATPVIPPIWVMLINLAWLQASQIIAGATQEPDFTCWGARGPGTATGLCDTEAHMAHRGVQLGREKKMK